MGDIIKLGAGRIWLIKFRAGPTHEPKYMLTAMADSPDWGQGDVTKIEIPSPTQYNQWDQVDSFQSSPDRLTSTLTAYDEFSRTMLSEILRLRCSFDVQIHSSNCLDPKDFDTGWDKIVFQEDAFVTGYGGGAYAAQQGENQASRNEELPYSARDKYDGLRMLFREVAKTEVGEEVIAVDVCDLVTCGDCSGAGSDGCQKVFAVTNSATSSPGLLPQVIITTDQYGTADIIERWVTTFAIGENAVDAACVGPYFVVLNSTSPGSIHYAKTQDMIDEAETWIKVATGFVALKTPNAIWNFSPTFSPIAANGGYLYLMKNPSDGVTVLDAGATTVQNLNDVSGWDDENFAAVGQALAWIYTTDGVTFSLGGPPVGTDVPTNLLAVAYRRENEIWVGGDSSSSVFYTFDKGDHWGEKAMPVTLTQIDQIIWASDSVGFIIGRDATPRGKILRTMNGGYSWYVMPEEPMASVPNADYFNSMAVCQKEVNKLFVGGLADNAADGILLKGTD